jgi:hypothetical protein
LFVEVAFGEVAVEHQPHAADDRQLADHLDEVLVLESQLTAVADHDH